MTTRNTSFKQPLILVAWANSLFFAFWFFMGVNLFSLPIEINILIYIFYNVLLVLLISNLIDNQQNVYQKKFINHQTDENYQSSMVKTAADAILITDKQGRITTWNWSAETLFGFDCNTMIGSPIAILFGQGKIGELEANWLFETTLRERFVRKHETIAYDSHGRSIHVELTATCLTYDQDEAPGISIVFRDITHRKFRENETQRLTQKLNQQVADRANELAKKVEQLALANSELTQLDQIRSEFVSLVSHQIRAPLTNMTGAVERMQTDCRVLNPTCNRMFAIFEQQVSRLDRLVQDVLNVTRIEMGEMILQLEPISVLPIVQQVVQEIETSQKKRDIRIVEKPGLPLIYADRDLLVEVLTNLLDNADKYSSPEYEIFVETRADENEVTLSVRDFGKGLALQDLARVFDKFYRADSSDSQIAYGYGLGLYVCRRLIEVQQGRIWAENHPEGGAIFSVALPVWEG